MRYNNIKLEEFCDLNYLAGTRLIIPFLKIIFPLVTGELIIWAAKADQISDPTLRQQALASLQSKKFHAQGGAVYALYPGVNIQEAVSFIVAFQTISDYLDNLCDRAGVQNETSFRQLHLAMSDALAPEQPLHHYYQFYPYSQDSGYLEALVRTCQAQIAKLPSFPVVQKIMLELVGLYSDLQALKHLAVKDRETLLQKWAAPFLPNYPQLSWWEFSAATGSTLGIFVLFAAASALSLTKVEALRLKNAYFPWICGLHILLDYYIDYAEDQKGGDLNFTSYYQNFSDCADRLVDFLKASQRSSTELPFPLFHQTVLAGLLSMYLSDPKALSGPIRQSSRSILNQGGPRVRSYQTWCRLLRFIKAL